MNLAVAYCRVSTKNQQESIKDQQEQWQDILEKENFTFANIGIFYKKNGNKEFKRGLYVDEGISAKEYKKNREAFKQMIEDAKNGNFNQIFVEDTTRFARNVEDGMNIVKDLRQPKYKVNIHFMKENIDSADVNNDLILGVLFSVAEKEITTDSKRFKWRQDKLHRVGKWTAPAPYGYNVTKGQLEINEKEKPVVDNIFYLYTEKLLGMRSIANYLNNHGFRTKKGNLWKSTEIRYLLMNKMYIGDIVNHKTESFDITWGTHKKIPEEEQIVVHNEDLRIIDDETWRKKEKIKEQRNKKLKNREGYSSKHLLSTLLYCEQCGSTYIRVKKKKAKDENGIKVDRGYEWTCLGHNHYGDIKCKGRYALDEKELIEFVKKELKCEKKRNREYLLDIYLKKKKSEIANIKIEKLKEEKEQMQTQIFEVREEKNKNLISEETYEEQIQAINERIDKIRIIEKKYYNLKLDIERAEQKYKERKEILNNLNYNKMTNADLKTIFNKIIVYGGYDETGYKNICLYFSYNFLDEIHTELERELDDIEHAAFLMFVPFQSQKIRKSTKTRYFENEDKK